MPFESVPSLSSAPKPPRPPSVPLGLASSDSGVDGANGFASQRDGVNGFSQPPSPPRVDGFATSTEHTSLLHPSSSTRHSSRSTQYRRRGLVGAAIAASTSFFGLPRTLSSATLRASLGLELDQTPGAVDWLSIVVVYWITLVSEASRGLMLPSTWPYLLSLGGTKGQLGLFVASFSVGRMATTVPLGYLSDTYSMSSVLTIASFIQIFGHFIYAVSPTVPVVIFSRVIVGFGSATMSVCRAHITRAVAPSLRTHHFAYLSALQFIGFAVLPGAGGALASLPQFYPLPFVHFNGFTYPAYVLIVSNFLAIALLYMFYFEPPRNISNSRHRQQVNRNHQQQQPPPQHLRQESKSERDDQAHDESVSAQNSSEQMRLVCNNLDMAAQSTTQYDSIDQQSPTPNVNHQSWSLSSSSSSQPVGYQSDTDEKRGNGTDISVTTADTNDQDTDSDGPSADRIALVVCLLVNITFRGIVAELETVATPFLMERYSMGYDSASYYITAVGFVGLGVYLGFKPISRRVSDRGLVITGLALVILGTLPLGYSLFTSHMSAAVYVACIGIIWSLAYPIGQTAILSLFSKVLAGLPAGGFLGIFSASGSLARILFALFAGKMWGEFGREAVFASVLGYVVLTLILTGVTFSRLVPPAY